MITGEVYKVFAEGKTKIYEVSNCGNLRSFNKSIGEYRYVKPRKTTQGELILHKPKKNGKGWETKYLKHLVAETFLSQSNQKRDGDYFCVWFFLDNNMLNCRADNIELISIDTWYKKFESASFNGFSKKVMDRERKAVKKHKLVIMKLFEAGAPISEIAHVFHRSPTTINNLIREAKKAKVA